MPYVQAGRFLTVQTPLGDDKLLLRSFTGQESISDLFHFRLDLLSEDARIDADALVGKNLTFAVQCANDGRRFFNGYVSRLAQLPGAHRLGHYQADVVPWLWFLTRTADCRIFQNQSVPDIATAIFADFGFTDYELRLSGTYPAREFCVQYRETAFNFISRLLEEEGIFYFFRHENGRHRLVLADAPRAFQPIDNPRIRFERVAGAGLAGLEDVIVAFEWSREFRSGQYAVAGYSFATPNTRVASSAPSQVDGAAQDLEIFDYASHLSAISQAERLARLRMEEEESRRTSVSGESNHRTLACGFRFELADFPRADRNRAYAVTSLSHFGDQSGFFSNDNEPPSYQNSFTAIPYGDVFRPPRVTRKPVVHGAQTATVSGPAGEEIYTDEHGRVKVQFHWDRRATADDKTSCWVRVSQAWAGKNWGAITLPRVGQEVIVEFLEGDPDQPIVSGRVYNGAERPPYPLPGAGTISSIKTSSSKGGAGFNEIRFEDQKGEEQVFIHAEKNLDLRVKNDLYETVARERHLTVKHDRLESVEGSAHETIAGNSVVRTGRDQHLTVAGNQAISVRQGVSRKVGGDVVESIANHFEQDSGLHVVTAKQVIVNSLEGVSVQCGSSSLVLNSAGVTISGPLITVDTPMLRLCCGPGSPPLPAIAPPPAPPMSPRAPEEADEADPGAVSALKARQREQKAGKYGSAPLPPLVPAPGGASLNLVVQDPAGAPMPGAVVRVTAPDGSGAAELAADSQGRLQMDGVPAGSRISILGVDESAADVEE